ncbi:hypothetical protein N0V88_005299 [Collariella sp. IMI 366227]|nr:hypothetical protein N0V88_005299 [Collariella sp. IMI 366227]
MTDATTPEFYPQYCFQLSPTINRWCHLRIADIFALNSHPGFQGQDVYFHHNHPIKWARVSGIVVAVDERETRHFYTIDDGSGATLECVVNLAPRQKPGPTAAGAATNATSRKESNMPQPQPKMDGPIEVGHVLDIKGSIGTFRDFRQIRAEKIVHLRSTEHEVAFWEKVTLLRKDVLSKPWVLDRREVRRCRKEEEGRYSSRKHKDTNSNRKRGNVEKTEVKKARIHLTDKTNAADWGCERNRHETKPLARRSRETGLEKRRVTKPATRLVPVTGKYDALGL